MNNGTGQPIITKTHVTPASNIAERPPICASKHTLKAAKKWFAMRCTYSREIRAKHLLETDGIECFVPMKKERIFRHDGESEFQLVPAVHNLIFIHTTREKMDAWKRIHEDGTPLRYIMDSATHRPIVVREKEMNDFIRVTTDAYDSITFLDHPESVPRKGQLVEIATGPFKGVRGHIIRIRRDRRIVVAVSGLMAAALAHMPLSHFKIVQDENHDS